MTTKLEMKLDKNCKHSVRYKTVEADTLMTIYVPLEFLPRPVPPAVTIIIEA